MIENLRDYTDEQIEDMYQQILAECRFRRDRKGAVAKAQFRLGDKVKFFSSKYGRELIGDVIGIGPKNVKVKVNYTTWTVSPTFLSLAEG